MWYVFYLSSMHFTFGCLIVLYFCSFLSVDAVDALHTDDNVPCTVQIPGNSNVAGVGGFLQGDFDITQWNVCFFF